MNRYGDTRVVDSIVRHRAGSVCAAIPERDWSFPVSTIRLVGEFTTSGGPIFDYFYVFVAGEPLRLFQVPMEALETVGVATFFADLEVDLKGHMSHGLANSTEYADRVMWPESLSGQPVFDYVESEPPPRRRRAAWFLGHPSSPVRPVLSASLQRQMGCVIDWAV